MGVATIMLIGGLILEFKLNEQIAFLRKKKGLTQEELAQVLGVTNQTVSKWEAAICCPDIQFLPKIATYFGVSVDELIGYKPVNTYANVYLQIKALFENTPQEEAFSIAFKLATLLHEGACTGGYKGYVPWDTAKNYTITEDCYKWGSSICSEPEGVTVHKANSVFISDNKIAQPVNAVLIKEIRSTLGSLSNINTLKVLFGIYELTVHDFDLFIPMSKISEKCKLSEETIQQALDEIPIQMKEEEDGQILYRIEGSYMHIPALLLMLINK
jgi:transcriptional regulator with XRE-family HTH domain